MIAFILVRSNVNEHSTCYITGMEVMDGMAAWEPFLAGHVK